MAVRENRSDVKQTTAGFRAPGPYICQKEIPIPYCQVITFDNDDYFTALDNGSLAVEGTYQN